MTSLCFDNPRSYFTYRLMYVKPVIIFFPLKQQDPLIRRLSAGNQVRRWDGSVDSLTDDSTKKYRREKKTDCCISSQSQVLPPTQVSRGDWWQNSRQQDVRDVCAGDGISSLQHSNYANCYPLCNPSLCNCTKMQSKKQSTRIHTRLCVVTRGSVTQAFQPCLAAM